MAAAVREDVEKAELKGRPCRNAIRCTGGSTSRKEAGAGLLLTGNSLPQLLLRLFMPIFRLTLTPSVLSRPHPTTATGYWLFLLNPFTDSSANN